ncbi:MAG: beta-hydroxyacyl-ACP dehydratase [Planctomycetales bacterium]|nr:beta-hydroxyacyl-ACP dehydratase [Planctomycetales bacterium]MCA9166163.1 beta-hydroxyacyl-ACP dehydratase [Planctomycetales bacterium]
MRWLWIDQFTEFESGRRASAVKCVSLVEEYIDGYFVGHPVMTPSFVIEGFAQMGGLLIGQLSDFRANLVLAKVSRSRFNEYARPGDQLRYEVQLESYQPDGGLVSAKSYLGDRLQGEAELTFAQVSRDMVDLDFFEPAEFLRMLRVFRLFDVGVDANGQPLAIPAHLLAADEAAQAK